LSSDRSASLMTAVALARCSLGSIRTAKRLNDSRGSSGTGPLDLLGSAPLKF
jgi:hypothetical protein